MTPYPPPLLYGVHLGEFGKAHLVSNKALLALKTFWQVMGFQISWRDSNQARLWCLESFKDNTFLNCQDVLNPNPKNIC